MKKTMPGASCTGQSADKTLTRPEGTPHPACGHLLPNAEKGFDDLLTQEEVAARLKVTVRTVARLQSEGVVPFILLGKSVRFYWPAVVSHLNTNSTVCRASATGKRPLTLNHKIYE
jgi:excisionase family DNA binding protein